MSRNVDWTKPLTGKDREWALQFPYHEARVLALDEAEAARKALEEQQVGDKPNYAKMTKAELVAEIERRNKEYDYAEPLSTDGTKEDLVRRLEDDDKADVE